jgi:hypothetical protein
VVVVGAGLLVTGVLFAVLADVRGVVGGVVAGEVVAREPVVLDAAGVVEVTVVVDVAVVVAMVVDAGVGLAADVVESMRLTDAPTDEEDGAAAEVVAPEVSADPLDVARTPVIEPELDVRVALAAGSTPEPPAFRATNHTTPTTTSSARTATVTRRTQYTRELWGPTGCITRSR